jgi:hypothetical protein
MEKMVLLSYRYVPQGFVIRKEQNATKCFETNFVIQIECVVRQKGCLINI